MVKQACFIAEAQSKDPTDSFATRFLGCEDKLHAAGQGQSLGALFNVGWTGVKHFAFSGCSFPFVVGHQLCNVNSFGHFDAIGCGCRNELT